jgi:hypothetical protein
MNAWGWHVEWFYSTKMLMTFGTLIAQDVALWWLGTRRTRRLEGRR